MPDGPEQAHPAIHPRLRIASINSELFLRLGPRADDRMAANFAKRAIQDLDD